MNRRGFLKLLGLGAVGATGAAAVISKVGTIVTTVSTRTTPLKNEGEFAYQIQPYREKGPKIRVAANKDSWLRPYRLGEFVALNGPATPSEFSTNSRAIPSDFINDLVFQIPTYKAA